MDIRGLFIKMKMPYIVQFSLYFYSPSKYSLKIKWQSQEQLFYYSQSVNARVRLISISKGLIENELPSHGPIEFSLTLY